MASDVIIFDLLNSSTDEVSNALQVLKIQEYETEKVLILISSVITWVNTPPKKKPTKDNQDTTGGEFDKSMNIDNSGIDETGEMIYAFEESDFSKRIPSTRYQSLKTIENQALAAMKTKENLKVYVLCAGILYGHGENSLYSHFKQAWMGKSMSLPVIGSGENIIPTIHVKDLSNIIKRISFVRPPHYYSFAVDKSVNQTQISLIKSISEGISTGEVNHIELDDVLYEDWSEFLSLNIRINPSSIFEELYMEVPELEDSNEFPWHWPTGIRDNVDRIIHEFTKFRGFNPMRIYLNGPPASGKTHYAKKLSEMYGIPHIKMADISKLSSTLEGPIGEEVRKFINTKKDEVMEEHEKAKKKGPELNRDDIVVRLPDKYIYKLAKIRLSENQCRNRGFILDGFPKSYIDWYHLFYQKKKKFDEYGNEILNASNIVPEGQVPPEGERPIDWHNDYELSHNSVPKLFIQITADLDFLKARVKELPEEKKAGIHWTDPDLDRRNASYNQNNNKLDTDPPEKKVLSDFFKEHNLQIFKFAANEEFSKTLDKIKQVVQKEFNPPAVEEPLEPDHDILMRYLERIGQTNEEEEKENVEEKKKEEAKVEEAKAKSRLDKIKEQERELLDTRSQPIRQYLMDKVVPLLTEGLIQICKEMPDNPTRNLAEYLFRRWDEIEKEAKEAPNPT